MTPPTPCPYLPGQEERKVFTRLSGDDPAHLNDTLADMGFRRSQNIAYRPACVGCNACQSARIPAARFAPGKTLRRIQNRNRHVQLDAADSHATLEQYNLLRRYLTARHADGGMANMTAYDYRMMVEESPLTTYVLEFRDPEPRDPDRGGKLIAASITDIVGDGLSMVYSFFDPDYDQRSLGNYMVLRHVQLAREMGLGYVYLGYWIKDCRKMAYKARFKPVELLGADGWREIKG